MSEWCEYVCVCGGLCGGVCGCSVWRCVSEWFECVCVCGVNVWVKILPNLQILLK